MLRTRLIVSTVVLALSAAFVGASPAVAKSSHAAKTTSGPFANLAAGTTRSFHLGGHAKMVRKGAGSTKVSVHITGLTAGATYAVHVHLAACSADGGGAHYLFPTPVSGGAGAGNKEIWPGPVTATGGGIGNGRAKVGGRAGVTAVSVVVHDTDDTKIGCADLS